MMFNALLGRFIRKRICSAFRNSIIINGNLLVYSLPRSNVSRKGKSAYAGSILIIIIILYRREVPLA